MKEVIIVGAGTAGLTVARELAKLGIDTVVYESSRRIGERVSAASGLVSKEGIERQGLTYRNAIINSVRGAIIHAGSESLRVAARSTKAYVLDRQILAKTLYKESLKDGVRVVLNRRLTKEELTGEEGVVIGADGAVSTVASTFSFPKIKEHILTYKAEYSLKNPLERKDMVELFFSKNTRGPFGWTIPYSKSTLEVGIGVSKSARRNSRAAFDDFVQFNLSKELSGARLLSEHASMIPIEVRDITVKGNVALVGDAAGQVKASTGGGIIFGTLCAKVLAKSVYYHLKFGRKLELYEKGWRSLYGRDLALHSLAHGMYSKMGVSAMANSLKVAKLFGFENFLSEYGDMDRPSLMLKRFFLRSID